jgi:hypothetical protein
MHKAPEFLAPCVLCTVLDVLGFGETVQSHLIQAVDDMKVLVLIASITQMGFLYQLEQALWDCCSMPALYPFLALCRVLVKSYDHAMSVFLAGAFWETEITILVAPWQL